MLNLLIGIRRSFAGSLLNSLIAKLVPQLLNLICILFELIHVLIGMEVNSRFVRFCAFVASTRIACLHDDENVFIGFQVLYSRSFHASVLFR